MRERRIRSAGDGGAGPAGWLPAEGKARRAAATGYRFAPAAAGKAPRQGGAAAPGSTTAAAPAWPPGESVPGRPPPSAAGRADIPAPARRSAAWRPTAPASRRRRRRCQSGLRYFAAAWHGSFPVDSISGRASARRAGRLRRPLHAARAGPGPAGAPCGPFRSRHLLPWAGQKPGPPPQKRTGKKQSV